MRTILPSISANRLQTGLCLILFTAIFVQPSSAQMQEEAFQLVASDGFELEAKIAFPQTDVDRVMVLIHGSGPQSMDSDLTRVTKEGKTNLFFVDVSRSLTQAGFATVRYNKRSYQTNKKLGAEPAFQYDGVYTAFAANPLKYFVEDAQDAVRYVEERFPGAEIYLLGHSQGAYIALQVASVMPQVRGVALIGYALSTTDTLVLEQTVYRPQKLFTDLDTNGDDNLNTDELSVGTAISASLLRQIPIIDLDGDGMVSLMEFRAGNLSNLFMRDLVGVIREQEGRYPRTAEILAASEFKVAFFQGLWDNQTPAYNAKAVDLLVRHVWRKDNFSFNFFPGLGHALDKRTAYDDLVYDVISPEANREMAQTLDSFFKGSED